MQWSRQIALIGREQPGDENLALRYLASALKSAGHRPILVPLNGPRSLPDAVNTVMDARPCLVGLSIPDADIAIDALAFARLLRAHGYQGHITAGGALATLARREILARHTDIDSVIRHEGEVPLVELVARLRAGRTWQDVPGVTDRQGDGPPAPVMDATPLRIRPLHPDPLPRLLGVAMARLSASRGCAGRCRYCGPAALQRAALDEGKRAGIDSITLEQAGVGRTRRRYPRDVAEEVAELYHDRQARFFHVLDDNLLAADPGSSAHWLRELLCELRRRKVERTAWSLQVEPVTLSDEVIGLLNELGVVRMALGIEAVTSAQLRALGRRGDTRRNVELLCRLRDQGVVTVFNSLMVHPKSTAASIGSELDSLSRLSGVHYDALAVAVYPGTELQRTLQREGRVTGGMFGLRFEPSDPIIARFRAALIHLRLQGNGRYGPMVMAHDVAVNLALARRFRLPGYRRALQGQLERVLNDLNAKRVSAWRAALALATADMNSQERPRAVLHLVSRHRADLRPVWEQLQRIQLELIGSETSEPARRGLLVASALAAGFTFCLVPAACGSQDHPDRDAAANESVFDSAIVDPGNDADNVDAATKNAFVDAAVDVFVDATREEALIDAAREEALIDAAVDASKDAVVQDASGCSDQVRNNQRQQAFDAVDTIECAQRLDSCSLPYAIVLDAEGRVADILEGQIEIRQEVRQCYLDALAGETFPCLAGDTIWQECVICLF